MVELIRTNETALWWLAAASVATFVFSLIFVPWAVIRLPTDYFAQRKGRHRLPWADQHPLIRVALLLGKNALGFVFVVAGIAMLVLPGQGILTVLVGIMLLDFPGKYRIERWLIGRRHVLRSINWLRKRAERRPLVV